MRSIQVLRACAATSVVVCHAACWPLGAAGVDIFFVISGFIVVRAAETKSAVRFATDRFWRIYPVYWLCLLPVLLTASVPTTARIASSLSLWPIYGAKYAIPYLQVAWTLTFEVLFYAAVTVAIATRRPLFVGIFFVTAMACNQVLGALYATPVDGLFSFLGSPMLLEFAGGALVGRLPRKRLEGATALALAVIVLWFAPDFHWFAGYDYRSFSRVIWWGLPALGIVYAGLTFEAVFASKSWNGALLLGAASYELYLVHTTILEWAPHWHWAVLTLLALVTGVLLHLATARPIAHLRNRWSPRRDSSALGCDRRGWATPLDNAPLAAR